ncbi:MAG: Na(+)-translocating NADH-quinone reductase subunit F [Flavobacteriaceae bacterium]|nr:Na(+)-translocating NADH-quinone reductase subunit F [Flavobacteriaceae bacterium]
MSRPLTTQELHNLAMNIVGKDLEAKGYEFIAINSQLKMNPQFVCINKNSVRYFVVIKVVAISQYHIPYDVIWMETIKLHAQKNKAKVLFANVGLGNAANKEQPPYLNEEYLLQYEGLQLLDVELN